MVADNKIDGRHAPKQEAYNGPKAPKSAYFRFADEVRPKVTEEVRAECAANGTSFAVSIVATKIGELWSNCDADHKLELEQRYKQDKTQHTAKMDAWKKTDDYKRFQKDQAQHKLKKADKNINKQAKESGMPKKPMAAYFMYSASITSEIIAQYKAQNGGAAPSMKERSDAIKGRWEGIGEAGQAEWQEKANAAKEEYKKDMDAWKETEAYETYVQGKEAARKRKAAADKKVKEDAKRQKQEEGA